MNARYRAFVGSRRKAETLRSELAADGVPAEALVSIKAPAGLDISAISSEEIALSILSEVQARFSGADAQSLRQRPGPIHPRTS